MAFQISLEVLWILAFSAPPNSSNFPSAVGLILTESFLSYLDSIRVPFLLSIICTTYSAWSCVIQFCILRCWEFYFQISSQVAVLLGTCCQDTEVLC